MPIFEYKCTECNSNYDVFHKTKEKEEDVICPSCSSKSHIKMMSTFSSVMSSGSSSGCEGGSCGMPSYGGGCANGMCGLN